MGGGGGGLQGRHVITSATGRHERRESLPWLKRINGGGNAVTKRVRTVKEIQQNRKTRNTAEKGRTSRIDKCTNWTQHTAWETDSLSAG